MARPLSFLATSAIAWSICGVGCSTLGPTPAEFAAREPAAVELGAAARETVQRETQAALLALLAGRPDDALKHADAAIGLDARAARAHAVRGRAILEAARAADPIPLEALERAEGELRLARRLDPADPEIRLLYAQFLEVDGHLTRATEELEQLLELAPEHLPGLRAAARLHFELGHERRAVVRLRALLRQTPADATAVFRLGQSEFRLAASAEQGDHDPQEKPAEVARAGYLRAADWYRKHVVMRPQDVAGYLGEASARFRAAGLLAGRDLPRSKQEYDQVEAILSRAAATDTTTPAPHHSLGFLYEQRGDASRARASYEAALRIDKDYLPSILNIARLLDAAGDQKSARDFCRRALRLPVSDAERQRLREYLGAVGVAKSP